MSYPVGGGRLDHGIVDRGTEVVDTGLQGKFWPCKTIMVAIRIALGQCITYCNKVSSTTASDRLGGCGRAISAREPTGCAVILGWSWRQRSRTQVHFPLPSARRVRDRSARFHVHIAEVVARIDRLGHLRDTFLRIELVTAICVRSTGRLGDAKVYGRGRYGDVFFDVERG